MHKQKTILAFIDWYRPGYKAGGTITAFGNFVDYLEKDFNFKIVTRNTDYGDDQPFSSIVSNKWIKTGNTNSYYISQSQLSSKTIKNIIKTTEYDILYVNGMFSFYFSILPIAFSKGKKTIVNPHGMLSSQAFSVKPLKKTIFLKIFNTFKVYKNIIFHAANTEEASMINDKIKICNAIKVANQFPRKIKNTVAKKNILNDPIRLVNVARIAQEKGTLKMIEALQNIQAEIILDIYGPVYDQEYWEKCKNAVNKLPKHVTVNHKGFIDSELVLEVIKGYDFFILLSEGENFGHSILEALSVGCPVIISNNTPWKDLKLKSIGWNVDINSNKEIENVFDEIFNMNEDSYKEMVKQSFIFAKNFSEDKELLNHNKNLFL
ncbi:glycosyltransferase family 4 protein [Psychroserpens sp. Hel_I_66]|uniref:glycosyltransferase family 4 protein n=1 Tax=Psychroserpens sp. Hel_I_66 TaxID=1250004 RepID=UPI0006477D28|nr:glycosyltransferase family 4 protein [Psychroserpens sp. Hel_I_66]